MKKISVPLLARDLWMRDVLINAFNADYAELMLWTRNWYDIIIELKAYKR